MKNKRPATAITAAVKALYIHKQDSPTLFTTRLGHGLWFSGPSADEVRRQAKEALSEPVDALIHASRRNEDRVRAVLVPLTDWIRDRARDGSLAMDIPRITTARNSGGCSFRRAQLYGFDAPPFRPGDTEHKETLWLTFEVEYSDPEDEENGESSKEVSLEVPKSLADAFNEADALEWMRLHNRALAVKRLADLEKQMASLQSQRETWNAWERQNS